MSDTPSDENANWYRCVCPVCYRYYWYRPADAFPVEREKPLSYERCLMCILGGYEGVASAHVFGEWREER